MQQAFPQESPTEKPFQTELQTQQAREGDSRTWKQSYIPFRNCSLAGTFLFLHPQHSSRSFPRTVN